MSVRTGIMSRGMACVLIATFGAGMPFAAQAQSCPPGYYYASDGNCYPVPPPTYPPPAYDPAPPVAAPPPVIDGLLIGLGLLVAGAILAGDRDHHGPPVQRHPPPRHLPPPRGHR